MKNLIAILVLSTFSLVSFSQTELSVSPIKTEMTTKNIKVKLKNNSLRSYKLYIPNVIELESVKLGANTFCMSQGQEMYFILDGKKHLLLTANSVDRNSYNLRRLVKERKKELGLN